MPSRCCCRPAGGGVGHSDSPATHPFLVILLSVLMTTLLIVHKGDALVITSMIVPSHVQRGSDAVLRCLYDLEEQSLYSVKWYKGRHEFFSYFPSEVPQFRVISWANLTIQYDIMEKGKVTLKSVTREAEGRYKCEVSTEAPHFNTDYREEDLTIYDISSEGPKVVADGRNELKPGTNLRFTCSFRQSRPKAFLSWYVDGQENIKGKQEARYVMLDSNESSSSPSTEMWAAESELFIWPTAKQMDRKWLQVTCRAVVLNETVYQRTSTLNVTAPMAGTSSLAQQIQRTSRPSSSSSSSSGQVSASMASSQHSGTSYSYPAANTGRGGTMMLTGRRRFPLLELLWLFVVGGLSAALQHS